MSRQNFFERMERTIDFRKEYFKLEDIILNKPRYGCASINDEISESFCDWKYRGNFTSFLELRKHLGFEYFKDPNYRLSFVPNGKIKGIGDFLVYCEMILNLINNLTNANMFTENKKLCKAIVDTIIFDVEKIGYEIVDKDGKILIVQKDVAATAVADIVEPDLGDSIIQYNHHLLKGNIETKKAILKKIADALEPKRKLLKTANKTLEDDFFYMVNNMNVRHNNCEPSDEKRYREKFAKLSIQEKEKWYDEIYQEGLMAFLTLQQCERERRIADFKEV